MTAEIINLHKELVISCTECGEQLWYICMSHDGSKLVGLECANCKKYDEAKKGKVDER